MPELRGITGADPFLVGISWFLVDVALDVLWVGAEPNRL